ncbi:MAG TPA: MFS transporter [Usitatibacter sp.]|nr:MFS transporter [Usitatibacter sp.]
MTGFSRSFRFFLWTRLAANSANQVLLLALGWQIYDLTSSAWDLGLVGLFQFLPALVLTIPSGQLADRVDRRTVVGVSLALQCAVALVLAWASAAGVVTRELIFGLGAVLGASRALQAPAQQAMVPTLVSTPELPRALASSSVMLKVAIIGGPALGGFLYVFGASVAYGSCAAMLLVALGLLSVVERVPRRPGEPVTLTSLFAGFVYMWRHPVVLGAISLDLFAVLLGGATALLPMFARDVLFVGPVGLGFLRAAPAVGGLLTAAWLARSPLERGVGRIMFASVAIYGAAILVFGFSESFALSLAALAVSGAADMVSVVIRQSLVQLETPDDMRGRVSAVNGTFIQASNQLGDFRAGAMADWLGAVGSVFAGAVGTLLVVALWMRLFPALVRRERLATSGE